MSFVERARFQVDEALAEFLEGEVLPAIGLAAERFWSGAAAIFADLAPENRTLLAERDALQRQVDDWWRRHRGATPDAAEQERFLRDIGYLTPEPDAFKADTSQVDDEVARLAGPQLVVPILNARFLLNAANARWGSLYDALYGTDALGDAPTAGGYNRERGARVIAWAKAFLDEALPLAEGSWADVTDADAASLADPSLRIGRTARGPLFRHHGLHIEIIVDREHRVGRDDPAGIADVVLESALTTICDLEDSVAAVDAADKLAAYRNWFGLMTGMLEERFEKGGTSVHRALNADVAYTDVSGAPRTLPGRSLLFVRNVGHLMTTPAVRLPNGSDAPEGILDAIITAAIGKIDLLGRGRFRNSRAGSIYIVKPKMHGPQEAAFANRLFDRVEDLLGLARHTMKIGVMDEERRTSANLAATIHAVRHRVCFINTGFLDRTGDEIHTAMQGGPVIPKGEMKASRWIAAYEDRNVQIGLACGLAGRAQIGKGMWAAPDRMADMLEQKIAHPLSGATTAWVPSPTAATLHATHYHRVSVKDRQAARASEAVAPLNVLLDVPLARGRNFTEEEVRAELDNNAQGILGYVVRWIDQGVGCSKVPDIHDVGLMEDRATLRISSQHIANWLLHGVVTEAQVDAALQRMAAKVDAQNAGDPLYRPMAGNEESSLAYQAARALIFEGTAQPSGYTEPLLHAYRLRAKAG